MLLPTLDALSASREMTDVFLGYNHNLRIGSGEFYDMKNLTSAYYPVLSPRGARGVYASPQNPQGLVAKDTLGYVDGSSFVLDGYTVDMGLSTQADKCPKTLVSMGAYVIILPDRKYINTSDLTDFGSIDASVSTTGPVSFELCRPDGNAYAVTYRQASEPTEPANMDLWIDTSTTPNSLKQYSETSGMWVSIATTYIKISSPGIGAAFAQYDGVTISGLKGQQLIDSPSGDTFTDADLDAIDGAFVVWSCGEDYLVIVGMLGNTRTIVNSITVAREMPEMDFVVESENRLWGCRYGVAANGKVVNEIYACKLGDFKNWNCFMGVSTDSYAASCGTDGQFTGAVTHLGYPLFFKENYLHKVYGNYPANYQIQTIACRGVQKGSARSLAIVGEVLFYKSVGGICAYDGSLPAEVSSALGETAYRDAIGCAHAGKYYVSMQDGAGMYHLFVYDTVRRLWHKEDNTRADAFCACRSELYYIDHADRKIKTVSGSGTRDTAPVEWMAETGIIGTDSPDKKTISKLVVRMSLEIGTRVYFYAQYDSLGEWEYLCTMTGSSLRSFSMPIRPKRCDHLRLRIVGEGDAKIYSITKTVEKGSDV